MPLLLSAVLTSTMAVVAAGPSLDEMAASFTAPAAPAPDFAALACAAYTFTPASPEACGTAVPTGQQAPDSGAPQPASATAPDLGAAASALSINKNPYFHRGSWRWQVTLAGATDFQDDHLGLAGVAASCFLEDNLTIDFELNGLYFHRDTGDSTGGLNLALLFRWHFLMDQQPEPDWSLYFDAGFGIAVSGSDVPSSGSDFNFTPQAGVGMSFRLGEMFGMPDAFLLTGIRWHHVSNANIFETNPGADRIMVYAGLNFPF